MGKFVGGVITGSVLTLAGLGIAAAISDIAEDKLSEPETIKNIGLDCKPFIHSDDESEEAQADA